MKRIKTRGVLRNALLKCGLLLDVTYSWHLIFDHDQIVLATGTFPRNLNF